LKYRIRITDTCLALIEKIPDKKIQRTILDRIKTSLRLQKKLLNASLLDLDPDKT